MDYTRKARIQNKRKAAAKANRRKLADVTIMAAITALFGSGMKSGDTIYGLAKRFGTSIDVLKGRNGLKTEMILIGQKLLITDTPVTTRAKVVGAIDKFTVEFQTATGTLPLKVSYRTAEAYQKLSGKEYILSYKNGALISIQPE